MRLIKKTLSESDHLHLQVKLVHSARANHSGPERELELALRRAVTPVENKLRWKVRTNGGAKTRFITHGVRGLWFEIQTFYTSGGYN